MELIHARRVTLQICILYKPEKPVILLRPGFRKTMDSWEDEGLFITQTAQSSTKADISAEMEGNVV